MIFRMFGMSNYEYQKYAQQQKIETQKLKESLEDQNKDSSQNPSKNEE